ncbi:MAG TPA: pentapeptide repeat-containing protein [Gammaproteobacteria bacterium]|nr:pentapeptide repeat-containing protein [Gammaproteobacteria bacterium]
MENQEQNNRRLWYIRRRGQIEGPFPQGLISRHILLGRIAEDDELSFDLVTWHPRDAFPELVPAVMQGEVTDRQAAERLEAARRWADERTGGDRRQGDGMVAQDRRRGRDRRRGSQSGRPPRTTPEALPDGGAGQGGRRWAWVLIPPALLLGGILVAVMKPGDETAAVIDCDSPPRAGIDWSNCFKEGVDLRGADLRGARMRNMRLTAARLGQARLRGTDLSYSELAVASLAGADLRDGVLVGAGLRGADLRSADLRGANLAYADLRGARLAGADLRGAVLGSAIWTDGRYCAPRSVGSCVFSAPPPRDRL